MSYIFSGIISDNEIKLPYPEDSEVLVLREISHPQLKCGALFANEAEEQIERPNQETFNLIAKLKENGINKGLWIYYCCWGGDIDCVAIAKVENSVIDMNSYSFTDNISYTNLPKLFSKFGINIEDSGHFEPFVRGYWGEHGY